MTRTTKQTAALLLASAVLIAAAATILYKKHNTTGSSEMLPVALHSIQLPGGGWGYEVLVDNKVYIRQDRIPSVQFIKSFVSEEEALRTGQLVVNKIKSGKAPALSVREIDSLHIHY